jgi:hypothetical protein
MPPKKQIVAGSRITPASPVCRCGYYAWSRSWPSGGRLDIAGPGVEGGVQDCRAAFGVLPTRQRATEQWSSMLHQNRYHTDSPKYLPSAQIPPKRYDLKLWMGSGGGSAAYLPG